MLRLNKNRNILYTLRDRELNSVSEPCKMSLNIISQLIRSDQTHYECIWHEKSSKPIAYDLGLLYFNSYTSCYTVCGHSCKPSFSHTLTPRNAKKKIIDVISYNNPVCKTFEHCKCKRSQCLCGSGFILCLTDDNWLCQYNLSTGTLIMEVYVEYIDFKVKFKYCDWDVYAERVILTSQLNPSDKMHSTKSDIVVNLAVFTTFPLEFSALLEIKRSVFGKSCKHVNVNNQLLILGMGYDRVHIYNFLDVLAKGTLKPYKLGDQYSETGKIGLYPTGIPLNFNIESVPPLLFDVKCFGQSVQFGGFPYHCIFPDPKDHQRFTIQNIESDHSTYVKSDVWNDEPSIVYFHPDNTNRIISTELLRVCVYDIIYDEQLKLKVAHSVDFQDNSQIRKVPELSAFGRKINRHKHLNLCLLSDRYIMATDYDDELDLFAVLGVCPTDPHHIGLIKLFDGFSGKTIKCIKLQQILCDTNYYQLHIDRDILIVIEKNSKHIFNIYVYRIAECV